MSQFLCQRRFSVTVPLLSAGLLLALLCPPQGLADSLGPSPVCPTAAFAIRQNGRQPLRAFATGAGVYELDVHTRSVRAWPIEPAALSGEITPSGAAVWDNPVDMFKFPGQNKIAVLDAAVYAPGVDKVPSFRTYSYTETASASKLTGVSFTQETVFNDMEVLWNYAVSVWGEAYAPLVRFDKALAFAWLGGEDWAVAVRCDNPTLWYSSSSGSFTPWPEDDTEHDKFYNSTAKSPYVTYVVVLSGFANPSVKDMFQISSSLSEYKSKVTDTNGDPLLFVNGVHCVGNVTGMTADTATKSIYVTDEDNNCVYRYDANGGKYEGWYLGYEDRYEVDPITEIRTFVGAIEQGYIRTALPAAIYGTFGVGGNGDPIVDPSFSNPFSAQLWQPVGGPRTLLVANKGSSRITGVDLSTGNLVFEFGEEGARAGQMEGPSCAYGSDDGLSIVVADTANGRSQIFDCSNSVLFKVDDSISLTGLPTVPVQIGTETSTTDVGDMVRAVFRNECVLFETDKPYTMTLTVAPATESRTYNVLLDAPMAGYQVVPAQLTIEPGETEATFEFTAPDGTAAGSTGSLQISGYDETAIYFTVTNKAPTFKASDAYFGIRRGDSVAYGAWTRSIPGTIFSVVTNLVEEGSSVTLIAHASDVASDPVTYDWYIYEQGTLITELERLMLGYETGLENAPEEDWFIYEHSIDYFDGFWQMWTLREKKSNAGETITVDFSNGPLRIAIKATDKDGASEDTLTRSQWMFVEIYAGGGTPVDPPDPPDPDDSAILSNPTITAFAVDTASGKATLSYKVRSTNGIDYKTGDYSWYTVQSDDLTFAKKTQNSMTPPTNLPGKDGKDVENTATVNVVGSGVSSKPASCFMRILAVPAAK